MSASKNLMMFGMTGSGKTLMVHALARSLRRLSGQEERDLAYSVKEVLGSSSSEQEKTKPVPDRWQPIEASGQRGDDFVETRYRIHKKEKGKAEKYEFSMFDGRGVLFKDILNSPMKDMVLKAFEKADGVIALLPVDNINSATLDELEMLADVMIDQKPKQKETIQNSSWLPRNIQKTIPAVSESKLAICLHKIDLLNVRWSKPEQVFQVVFGNAWSESLRRIQNKHGVNIAIRFFVTSSLGFAQTLHNPCEIPNSVSMDGRDQIKYPDEWSPWNVEHPFLWILEGKEEEILPVYW
jgi:hypothetical protein